MVSRWIISLAVRLSNSENFCAVLQIPKTEAPHPNPHSWLSVAKLFPKGVIALRHYQKIQPKQGFAEVNNWSKIVQPPESGQSMSMLIKTLR
jgi:hypothetical protein